MAKKKPDKVEEASKILGITKPDLELALEMLDALKRKLDAWEKQGR
jgi:hypothetical protein